MDYAVQYPALQRRYESLLADMRRVHDMLRRGRHRQALALLNNVLDQSDTSGTSDAESMAESMLARVSSGWQPFSGRGSRLD